MVATLEVDFDKGGVVNAPGTPDHNITNLRFNNEDTNDQDFASPITIPAGADVFSFWKHIFLHCTVAPSVLINNMKIYTDGTLGFTAVTINVGDGTQTKNSGSSAGYDPGQALTLTIHDTIAAFTDFFTFTSGAPRTVSISEASNQIDAIGELTDYIILSMTVPNIAIQGIQSPAETSTWEWDEV